MKKIYFVRHGQSESNVQNIISGSGSDIHITAVGREQAKAAGQKLKDKQIQLVVCSPMIRTVETATIIAEQIGYDPKAIVTDPIFIERSYGIYEGHPATKFEEDKNANIVHESVETEKQVYDRMKLALQWLRERQEDRIVVVSHGGARRAVYVINNNLHHSHMYKIERFGNGEIDEFSL